MDYGFVRVAALTPKIRVADTEYNKNAIKKLIDEAYENSVRLAVFPELCITGYTCSDLFLQKAMLDAAVDAVVDIAEYTKNKHMAVLVGLPFAYRGKLYNVAAVLAEGEVIGLVPKTNIPNYSEFYEARHFTKGFCGVENVNIGKFSDVPFGTDILFENDKMESFRFSVEICEDLWVPMPPSVRQAMAGSNIIANLSASDETTGKADYRYSLIAGQSARLVCGYVYATAGEGESTTDLVFSGHNIIAENGSVMSEAKRFQNEAIYADIDVEKLEAERRRMTTYPDADSSGECFETVYFSIENKRDDRLLRFIDKAPFVPSDINSRERRCEEILMMQAMGLKKRLKHTNVKTAVVGISGGLDSTLALLVTVKAFDMLGKKRKDIIAVTMPGFGTTDRTYTNAVAMIKSLGATFMEVPISEAVLKHFNDINHDKNIKDVTYENAQARQRTFLLMDIACENGGMVIGTGDMSELALGWATYNGDHMSMYGVNASVPKTLVRHLVKYYADTCGDDRLKDILYDVLDTPVSPELLPPEEDGSIAQKTEDLVGPYELHDFYLYNVLRFGYEPSKVYYLAKTAFAEEYDNGTILKWLKVFYRRFFTQQFKRSCLPDGVKVGSVTVSPRGELRMPSDARAELWLEQLEKIKA